MVLRILKELSSNSRPARVPNGTISILQKNTNIANFKSILKKKFSVTAIQIKTNSIASWLSGKECHVRAYSSLPNILKEQNEKCSNQMPHTSILTKSGGNLAGTLFARRTQSQHAIKIGQTRTYTNFYPDDPELCPQTLEEKEYPLCPRPRFFDPGPDNDNCLPPPCLILYTPKFRRLTPIVCRKPQCQIPLYKCDPLPDPVCVREKYLPCLVPKCPPPPCIPLRDWCIPRRIPKFVCEPAKECPTMKVCCEQYPCSRADLQCNYSIEKKKLKTMLLCDNWQSQWNYNMYPQHKHCSKMCVPMRWPMPRTRTLRTYSTHTLCVNNNILDEELELFKTLDQKIDLFSDNDDYLKLFDETENIVKVPKIGNVRPLKWSGIQKRFKSHMMTAGNIDNLGINYSQVESGEHENACGKSCLHWKQYNCPERGRMSCTQRMAHPCVRIPCPFRSFTECCDYEIPEIDQCSLLRDKLWQPAYPIIPERELPEPPPPLAGPIDPEVEEVCCREKRSIANVGKTVTCIDGSCVNYEPLRERTMLQPRKREPCAKGVLYPQFWVDPCYTLDCPENRGHIKEPAYIPLQERYTICDAERVGRVVLDYLATTTQRSDRNATCQKDCDPKLHCQVNYNVKPRHAKAPPLVVHGKYTGFIDKKQVCDVFDISRVRCTATENSEKLHTEEINIIQTESKGIDENANSYKGLAAESLLLDPEDFDEHGNYINDDIYNVPNVDLTTLHCSHNLDVAEITADNNEAFMSYNSFEELKSVHENYSRGVDEENELSNDDHNALNEIISILKRELNVEGSTPSPPNCMNIENSDFRDWQYIYENLVEAQKISNAVDETKHEETFINKQPKVHNLTSDFLENYKGSNINEGITTPSNDVYKINAAEHLSILNNRLEDYLMTIRSKTSPQHYAKQSCSQPNILKPKSFEDLMKHYNRHLQIQENNAIRSGVVRTKPISQSGFLRNHSTDTRSSEHNYRQFSTASELDAVSKRSLIEKICKFFKSQEDNDPIKCGDFDLSTKKDESSVQMSAQKQRSDGQYPVDINEVIVSPDFLNAIPVIVEDCNENDDEELVLAGAEGYKMPQPQKSSQRPEDDNGIVYYAHYHGHKKPKITCAEQGLCNYTRRGQLQHRCHIPSPQECMPRCRHVCYTREPKVCCFVEPPFESFYDCHPAFPRLRRCECEEQERRYERYLLLTQRMNKRAHHLESCYERQRKCAGNKRQMQYEPQYSTWCGQNDELTEQKLFENSYAFDGTCIPPPQCYAYDSKFIDGLPTNSTLSPKYDYMEQPESTFQKSDNKQHYFKNYENQKYQY